MTDELHIKTVQEVDSYRTYEITIGTLYFKLLISKTKVDTWATAIHFRENIMSLDSCMTPVNSNAKLFNLHVKKHRQGFKTWGEHTYNLKIHLFKVFMDASARKFAFWIKPKMRSSMRSIIHQNNKHVNKKRDIVWSVPSNEWKHIVALRASSSLVKKESPYVSKAIQFQCKKISPKETHNKDNIKKDRNNKGKGKGTDNPWEWKELPPLERDSKTKKKGGKKHNWYKHHQVWLLCSPE